MATILKGIEAQPLFPRQDLSEDNAAILEMMLSNRELSQIGHVQGERFIPPFQQMHPATIASVQRIYESAPRDAVDHGAALFETVSLMLAVNPQLQEPVVTLNAAGLVHASTETDVRKYIDAAYDALLTDTPRTAEVIKSSSERFYGAMATYALVGAGLMRQQELDAEIAIL